MNKFRGDLLKARDGRGFVKDILAGDEDVCVGEGGKRRCSFGCIFMAKASPIIRKKSFGNQLLHSASHHDLCISWGRRRMSPPSCKMDLSYFDLE
jgi:hypothetical protein